MKNENKNPFFDCFRISLILEKNLFGYKNGDDEILVT